MFFDRFRRVRGLLEVNTPHQHAASASSHPDKAAAPLPSHCYPQTSVLNAREVSRTDDACHLLMTPTAESPPQKA